MFILQGKVTGNRDTLVVTIKQVILMAPTWKLWDLGGREEELGGRCLAYISGSVPWRFALVGYLLQSC